MSEGGVLAIVEFVLSIEVSMLDADSAGLGDVTVSATVAAIAWLALVV